MRKLFAPAVGAVATVVLLAAPAAQAQSKYTDIRVVTSAGKTLTDHRQYTDDVRFSASRQADCFGDSNPSSNKDYALDDPTALSGLVEASENVRALRPLLITDAFFDDFGSFGVCGIGGEVGGDQIGEPYWYLAVDGVGATAGPNQIKIQNRTDSLWYLASGEVFEISQLSVDAPVRVRPNQPFSVTVTRTLPDGSTEPAEGVRIGGETTNEDGTAELSIDEGTKAFVARGGPGDVFSPKTTVCAADPMSECPSRLGLNIIGSNGKDRIRATRGADRIRCGEGNDTVVDSQPGDKIAGSCETVN